MTEHEESPEERAEREANERLTELAERCIVHPAYLGAKTMFHEQDQPLRKHMESCGVFIPENREEWTQCLSWQMGFKAGTGREPAIFQLNLVGLQRVVVDGGEAALRDIMLRGFPLAAQMSDIEFQLRRSSWRMHTEPTTVPTLLELLECAARGEVQVKKIDATVLRVKSLASDPIECLGLFIQPKAELHFNGKKLKTIYRGLNDLGVPFSEAAWQQFVAQPGMDKVRADLQAVWDSVDAQKLASRVKNSASVVRKDKATFAIALAKGLRGWPKDQLPPAQALFDWLQSKPALDDERKICGQTQERKVADWLPSKEVKNHYSSQPMREVAQPIVNCLRELIKVENRHRHKMENVALEEIQQALDLVEVAEVMES